MQSGNFQGRFCPSEMNTHLYDSSGQRIMPNSSGISNQSNNYPPYHGGTDYSFMSPTHQHQGDYSMYQHGFHSNHMSHNMQYSGNQNMSSRNSIIGQYNSSSSEVYPPMSQHIANQDPYNNVTQSNVRFQPIWENSNQNNSVDSSIMNSPSHSQNSLHGPRNNMMCSPPVLRSPSAYPMQGSPGYPSSVSTVQLNQITSPNHSPHSWNQSTSPGLAFAHAGNNGNSGIKSPPSVPSPSIYSPTRSPNYTKPFSPPVPAKSPSHHVPSPMSLQQQPTQVPTQQSSKAYDVSVNQHSFNMGPHNKASPPLNSPKTCKSNPLQSLQKMVMFSESHPVSPIARANKEIIGNTTGQICTPPPNNPPISYKRDVECHMGAHVGSYSQNIVDGKMIGSDFRQSVSYPLSSKEHSRNPPECEMYGALSNPTTPVSESSNASTLSETRSLDSAKNEPAVCAEKNFQKDDVSDNFLTSNFRPNPNINTKNTFEERIEYVSTITNKDSQLFQNNKAHNHVNQVVQSSIPEDAMHYRMPRCGDSPSTYTSVNTTIVECESDEDDEIEEIEQTQAKNLSKQKDVNKVENDKIKLNVIIPNTDLHQVTKNESAINKSDSALKDTVLPGSDNATEQPHRHWRKRTSLTASINAVDSEVDSDSQKPVFIPRVELRDDGITSQYDIGPDRYGSKIWNRKPLCNIEKTVNGPISDTTSLVNKAESPPSQPKIGIQSHSSLIELKDNLNKMQKCLGNNPCSAFFKKQNYNEQLSQSIELLGDTECPALSHNKKNSNIENELFENKEDTEVKTSSNCNKLNNLSPSKLPEKLENDDFKSEALNDSASDLSKKKRGRPIGSKNRYKVKRRRKWEMLKAEVKTKVGGNRKKKNGKLHIKKKKRKLEKVTGCNITNDRGTYQGPYIRVSGTRAHPKSFSVVNTSIQKDDEKNIKKKKSSSGPRMVHKIKGTLSSQPPPNAAPAGKHWVCVMCGKGSNFMGLGDLFGPYYLDTSVNPHLESVNENSNNSSDMNTGDSSEFGRKAKKTKRSDSVESITKDGYLPKKLKVAKARKLGISLSSPTNLQPSIEIWVHEDCIVWSHGVYLVGNKMYGLQEAAQVAKEMVCSKCKANGATLGCLNKGCTEQYHYICALEKACQMDEEKFSLLCPKHKDKRKINQPAESSNTC